MNTSDIVLLGMKKRVAALARSSGEILWSTKLRSGAGHEFVTLISDEKMVFASCGGWLHALDLFSGAILWSNELEGYGYGLASLCLPDGGSAPNLAAVQQIKASEAAAAAASSSAAAH